MAPDTTRHDPWGEATEWPLIRRAAHPGCPEDQDGAWEDLIERYEGPIEAALRRRLRGHPESERLAQDFFAYLFERDAREEGDWALATLRRALERMRRGVGTGRQAELLAATYPAFGDGAPVPREELRARHGLSANALDVTLSRARTTLRRYLVDEVRRARREDGRLGETTVFARLLDAGPGAG